jgi:sugar lactone lactonase YvrE
MRDVQCIWPLAASLGEGPVWVERERAIYFVDIMDHTIHRLGQDGECHSWRAPAEPGFIVPCRGGGFICGLRGGLYGFEPATSTFTFLVPVENEKPQHRINDGHVDSTGRLWFGTMNEDSKTIGGALYSWRKDEPLQIHDGGYVVTNGPASSHDGRTLYHTDSICRTVYAFDLSADGTLSSKRPFIQYPEDLYPDGMVVDETGNLWIAVFNGWRIEQYSQQGKKLSEIRFPCANITKPAFGGNDLRTLYVTTALVGLSPESRAKQPLAGGLFAVDVPVGGLKPTEVSGPDRKLR